MKAGSEAADQAGSITSHLRARVRVKNHGTIQAAGFVWTPTGYFLGSVLTLPQNLHIFPNHE